MSLWSETLAARGARCWVLGIGVLATLVGCGGGEGGLGEGLTAADARTSEVRYQLDSLVGNPHGDELLVQIKTVRLAERDRPSPRFITLPELTAPKLAAAGEREPQQIGVARVVNEAANDAATAALLDWTREPEGSRAAIGVHSPGAKGLRLGLRVTQLPPGAVLRVYAPDEADSVEVHAQEVLRTLQRHLNAGLSDAEARTYWLPTVDAPQAVLEVRLPAGVDPALVKVAVPVVSHLVQRATSPEVLLKAAGACNVDVMCTSGNESRMRAVALMSYTKGGNSYVCSGTLMNNTRQDWVPYFLSADHCISTQASASSLETYWNARSASCGSAQVTSEVRRLEGGAQLLWNSAATDTSFMRLNGTPPASAVFAGWDASTPGERDAVFSIHHPAGGIQKFSEGMTIGFRACQPAGEGSSLCGPATVSNGMFLGVQWSRGVTEGGSSGGPLFSSAGRVIGQLQGGSSSCANPLGQDTYGRFDLAFNAALKNWLSPNQGSVPLKLGVVYRFYNAKTNAHFYTNNALERDFVIDRLPEFQYEGPRFQAASEAADGVSPVYRFYNAISGAHFYTISAAERDFVNERLPEFKYEGTAWYAQTGEGNNAGAMHRFYNTVKGAHFYTNIPGEVDFVRQRLPEYRYEGVAYYAWPN